MSALRRRELVALAEQAGASSAAGLALVLEALERQRGYRVQAATDDEDVAARGLVVVGRPGDPLPLVKRLSTHGGWTLSYVDGALVLCVHGKRRSVRRDVLARVRNLRTRGHSLQAIADQLNADGVETLRGGKRWHAGTVHYMLKSSGR